MKIKGSDISAPLYVKLKAEAEKLNSKPTLLVMLIGNDVSSEAYIKQKQKYAKLIGADVILKRYQQNVTEDQLYKDILSFNNNPKINGIIIQQPLPPSLNPDKLLNHINKTKEV